MDQPRFISLRPLLPRHLPAAGLEVLPWCSRAVLRGRKEAVCLPFRQAEANILKRELAVVVKIGARLTGRPLSYLEIEDLGMAK